MEKTIVVMGGGGVKGMAHAGAWRAILESGVSVSELIGTSIGGLVAACLGGGMTWQQLYERAAVFTKQDIVGLNRWALLLNGIRQPSIFRGEPLRDFVQSLVPVQSFLQMKIPVSINAVDLETGAQVWFGAAGRKEIPVSEAVYASCSLPVFYPPVEIEGELYVDGGVRDGLPILLAKERGATRIIAIDVGAGEARDSLDTVSKGLIAIHHRVTEIMGHARKKAVLEEWSGPELIYVRPRLDEYSTFDFAKTEFFLNEGFRATREALWMAGLGGPPVDSSDSSHPEMAGGA